MCHSLLYLIIRMAPGSLQLIDPGTWNNILVVSADTFQKKFI